MTQNPLPIRSGEKTAAAEMDRTDVSFKTSDGVTLRGWFFTPKSSTTKTKLPCVILTHGISCVKEMGLGEVASKLAADLPSTCLVFDQRGFGASDTAPHAPRQEIATWLQANDLRDAITYAQTREEVDKDKIALWGYSLGGAVSVYVAAIDRRVKAVVALAPGMDGNEIVRRLAPPHALNAMRALFEVDRLARAEGKAPITVPIISGEPGGQCLLPSPESYAFFVEWEKEGSPWKNELTLRSLDDASTFALPMSHLENVTPTPVFYVVAAKDTNSPPDMGGRWYAKLSEPKEYVLLDVDHYELMGVGRETLHPKEVAFLKKSLGL